ncbi:MAG TPA: hypothetical protein VM100_02685 [Longimicrobiales bacterium]|nr:hypothetical protein [Longimicrobiales bacterium]
MRFSEFGGDNIEEAGILERGGSSEDDARLLLVAAASCRDKKNCDEDQSPGS